MQARAMLAISRSKGQQLDFRFIGFSYFICSPLKRISQQEEQQPGRGKAKREREREREKRGCVIYYYNYIFSMCGFYNLYLYAKEYLKIRRYEVYGKTVTQDLFNVLIRSSPVLALWRPLVVAYLCYLSYYLKMASLFPSWLPVNLHLLKYLEVSPPLPASDLCTS